MAQSQQFPEVLVPASFLQENPPPYRVVAYITAYEDAAALNTCLEALKAQSSQVQHILIVDNSAHPLPLRAEFQHDETILVQVYPENIGIAGGLEIAIAWATQQRYDFLWTFDQDSTPLPDCLERLLATYTQLATPNYPIAIVAPTPIDARTGEIVQASRFLGDRFQGFPPPSSTTPYECDAPITSGSLVWIGAASQIPPPDRALFMDGIDLEYGLRLRQAGFHNLVVPAAQMIHRFGTPVQVQLGSKKKAFQIYSSLRYYYICRNQTYIEWQHALGWQRLTCGLWRLRYLLLTVGIILLVDPNSKLEKIRACLLGTYDGFAGKLGKTWP